MRLVSYQCEHEERAGVVHGERVFDVRSLVEASGAAVDCARWSSLRDVLEAGPVVMERLRKAAASATVGHARCAGRLDSLTLGPPVPDARKVICVGLNYRDHLEETGRRPTEHPTLFAKFATSLAGPRADVLVPAAARDVDYEGELAVVVGSPARELTVENALEHVAGVMVVNDVTSRAMQYRTTQWLHGKAIDTFAPCGPALVTLDEVGDIQALGLRTRVNGELVQDASTAQMLWSVPELLASITQGLTLLPGDIVCTGTPGGIGSKQDPPRWLHDGDVVEVEIDRVGTLRNTVRAQAPRSRGDR